MTPLSPFVFHGIWKCKISFYVYSYKSATYRVFSNFFGHILVFGSEMLYLCTSNRKKASLVPQVGLYRRHIWVSIGVRRRTSITTQIRARNGASGELKYQPFKHTQLWLTTVLPCAQWTVTSLLSIRLNHVSTRQKREGKNPDQADINLVKTEKKNAFAVSQYSDVMTIEKFAKHIKVYCINDI